MLVISESCFNVSQKKSFEHVLAHYISCAKPLHGKTHYLKPNHVQYTKQTVLWKCKIRKEHGKRWTQYSAHGSFPGSASRCRASDTGISLWHPTMSRENWSWSSKNSMQRKFSWMPNPPSFTGMLWQWPSILAYDDRLWLKCATASGAPVYLYTPQVRRAFSTSSATGEGLADRRVFSVICQRLSLPSCV